MKTAYYIGMDIAKLNFQVHGADKRGGLSTQNDTENIRSIIVYNL